LYIFLPVSCGILTSPHTLWLRSLSDGVYVASQLNDTQIERLAKNEGVQTIFNLRDKSETNFVDHAQSCKSLGVTYFDHPLAAKDFALSGCTTALDALASAARPVVIQWCEMTVLLCFALRSPSFSFGACSATSARAVALALLFVHGRTQSVDELLSRARALSIDLNTKAELKAALAQILTGSSSSSSSSSSHAESKSAAAPESKAVAVTVPSVQCLPHMDTFTCVYLVSCPTTKQAVIIDSALDYDQPRGAVSYKVRSRNARVLPCMQPIATPASACFVFRACRHSPLLRLCAARGFRACRGGEARPESAGHL
jgi:protein tyrosine phosphatase (PTP) superfamily phosphohydrolase (DUF442 family)